MSCVAACDPVPRERDAVSESRSYATGGRIGRIVHARSAYLPATAAAADQPTAPGAAATCAAAARLRQAVAAVAVGTCAQAGAVGQRHRGLARANVLTRDLGQVEHGQAVRRVGVAASAVRMPICAYICIGTGIRVRDRRRQQRRMRGCGNHGDAAARRGRCLDTNLQLQLQLYGNR